MPIENLFLLVFQVLIDLLKPCISSNSKDYVEFLKFADGGTDLAFVCARNQHLFSFLY